MGWQQGYGFQLWVSDGNADSTKVLYTDSFNEVGSIGFTRYCELNNKLYYTIDGKNIYGTDGSKGGTFLLTKTDNNFAGLVKYKNELYFSNNDSLGNELRKSDGTPLNVSIVKDIDPTNSSYPLICGVVNNRLLFYANDSIHGYELWATNGTDTGTYLIKDCNPKGDIEDRNFYGFHSIVAGNKLFFAVQQRDTILPCCSYISNLNLWATDGTSAGSAPFNSIKLYNGFYYTDKDFIILNNKLFFYEENNISLDSFYYTRTDTIETYNLTANCSNFPAIPTYQNSNYHNFGFYANEIDGKLYYSEYYNHGLAVTDATCFGTTVYSAKPDYIATVADRSQMIKYKNAIYLIGNMDSTGYQLWRLRDVGLGVEETKKEMNVKISPNPAQNQVTLYLSSLDEVQHLQYTISNLVGQKVQEGILNSKETLLDIHSWSGGMYLVNVNGSKGERWSGKVVKE